MGPTTQAQDAPRATWGGGQSSLITNLVLVSHESKAEQAGPLGPYRRPEEGPEKPAPLNVPRSLEKTPS